MNIIEFLFGFPVSGCNVTQNNDYILMFDGCKWSFVPYTSVIGGVSVYDEGQLVHLTSNINIIGDCFTASWNAMTQAVDITLDLGISLNGCVLTICGIDYDFSGCGGGGNPLGIRFGVDYPSAVLVDAATTRLTFTGNSQYAWQANLGEVGIEIWSMSKNWLSTDNFSVFYAANFPYVTRPGFRILLTPGDIYVMDAGVYNIGQATIVGDDRTTIINATNVTFNGLPTIEGAINFNITNIAPLLVQTTNEFRRIGLGSVVNNLSAIPLIDLSLFNLVVQNNGVLISTPVPMFTTTNVGSIINMNLLDQGTIVGDIVDPASPLNGNWNLIYTDSSTIASPLTSNPNLVLSDRSDQIQNNTSLPGITIADAVEALKPLFGNGAPGIPSTYVGQFYLDVVGTTLYSAAAVGMGGRVVV